MFNFYVRWKVLLICMVFTTKHTVLFMNMTAKEVLIKPKLIVIARNRRGNVGSNLIRAC